MCTDALFIRAHSRIRADGFSSAQQPKVAAASSSICVTAYRSGLLFHRLSAGRTILKFLSFLLSRLGKAVVVILGVVIINFLLIRLAPGDPAAIMAGEAGSSDPAYLAQLRTQFGFDEPLYQ